MTILNYQTPQANIRPRPVLWVMEKILYAAYGIVLPVVMFAMAWGKYPFAIEYQSGRSLDVITLMLSDANAWPFYPLLGISIAALARFIIWPESSGGKFMVRFGLLTGVILAAQFSLIQNLALSKETALQGDWWVKLFGIPLIGVAVGLFVLWIVRLLWLIRKYFWITLAVLAFVGAVAIAIQQQSIGMLLEVPYIGSFMVGPMAATAVYTSALMLARKQCEPEPVNRNLKTFLPIGWVIALIAAWRASLYFATISYAALPTTQPGGCYIATAAARGHRRFVRGRSVRTASGEIFQVNDQLRNLKFAELAIATSSPRLHRAMRKIYDFVGPPIARRANHALLADLAYVALKSVEWPTIAILTILFPRWRKLAGRLYVCCDNKPR